MAEGGGEAPPQAMEAGQEAAQEASALPETGEEESQKAPAVADEAPVETAKAQAATTEAAEAEAPPLVSEQAPEVDGATAGDPEVEQAVPDSAAGAAAAEPVQAVTVEEPGAPSGEAPSAAQADDSAAEDAAAPAAAAPPSAAADGAAADGAATAAVPAADPETTASPAGAPDAESTAAAPPVATAEVAADESAPDAAATPGAAGGGGGGADTAGAVTGEAGEHEHSPGAESEGGTAEASASASATAATAPPEAQPPPPPPPAAAPVPTQHTIPLDGYDPSTFRQVSDPSLHLPSDALRLAHMLSLESYRHNGMHLLDENTLLTAAGGVVVLLDLATSPPGQRYLPSIDGGGIGAVAVHPSRAFLAVAEKCRHRAPNVYVYTYPELKLSRVLRSGTERAYSALAFDAKGDSLATVGGFPDFLMTLWAWRDESIVLRSKAFSQDVYTVRFSPYFDGQLCTAGMGHIRFWRMAATFTGLKLQGQIGKFGAVELTDVEAFVELPDGKVLSSTETGELIMWDGGLIKVVLTRPNGRPCHDGAIKVLHHNVASNVILSGGADGVIRLWDFTKLNDVEPEEDSHHCSVTPVDEVLVGHGSRIKNLIWDNKRWLVQDEAGGLFIVTLPASGSISKGATVARLLEYHSGALVGLATSMRTHTAVTAGTDGSIRVWNFLAQQLLHQQSFTGRATAFCTLPTALDTVVSVVALGFKDGTVRVVSRACDGLHLSAAFKPHKASVRALAFSSDASLLATCAEDGTVFFFRVTSTYPFAMKPLAFTHGPANITCAVWAPGQQRLTIGFADATVMEVEAPSLNVDVSKTYEVQLPSRALTFKLPRPKRLVPKKKPEDQAAAGAEGASSGNADSGTDGAGEQPQDGEATAGKDGAGDAPPAGGSEPKVVAPPLDDEDEEEWEEYDEEGDAHDEAQALAVVTMWYAPGDPDTLFLTAKGKGIGKIWRCSWSTPDAAATPYMPSIGTAATTTYATSPSGRFALIGAADGMVRVQPLGDEKAMAALAARASIGLGPPPSASAIAAAPKSWEAPVHDMLHGHVAALAMSHDETCLLSAGRDGVLCIMDVAGMPGVQQRDFAAAEELLPLAGMPPPSPDIADAANSYTVEEEKQKAEQDELMRLAELKKLSVREQLAVIRRQFEALLAENHARSEAERLPRSEFEIDPGLREMMGAEAAAREEAARRSLAWETEKRRLALAKLRAFFLEGVEVERIVLYSLGSPAFVTTFRTAKLSESVKQELAALKAAAAAEAAAGAAASTSSKGADANGGADGGTGADGTVVKGGDAKATVPGTAGTMASTRPMNKADIRRAARKQREAEWAAFAATKPDEQYENPADVAAIEEAERTVGDFKLKSDPNYVIPEEERMTPQRKRHQMLLLEEAMHDLKMDFNQRLLALREVKRKVVAEISSRIGKLHGVNKQLSLQEDLPEPCLKPEEFPEQREVVTAADIEEATKKKEEDERKAAQGSALGGFATGGGAKKPAAAASPAPAGGAAAAAAGGSSGKGTSSATAGGSAATAGKSSAPGGPGAGASGDILTNSATSAEDALAKMMAAVPLSDLEKGLAMYNRRRLEYQRTKIKGEISSMIDAFDGALSSLRREKLRLEADLKRAETRQLLHYQELGLLREFDKREQALMQKRQAKLDDRQDLLNKISECNDKLDGKKLELEGLISRRAAVVGEFDAAVPDSDPFREQLSKTFFRKIKRVKKKVGADDDDDDDDDDGGGGDDEGEEDDEDEGGEEVCPPGCDQTLYERVCDLREKRLDEEDMVGEFQKTIELLKKEKEGLAKKQKLVDQALAAVNSEMADFQREKQGRLNQLDVVVALRLRQVQYLVDARLPQDLSAALVFNSSELSRLRRRIDELEGEKGELRSRQKELRREHAALLRDKASKEERVTELERRALDVQMLKFGQVIDMELLDKVGATQGTEELQEELKAQEQQYARELAEWDVRIAGRTDELVALTRENTAALNAVSELTAAQRRLESGLTATRKGMFQDPVQQRRAEVEERDALVALVNAQAAEIEKLKAQIGGLRRKDASVYS